MGSMASHGSDRVAAFTASMPAVYRQSFDEEAQELHAAIVERRIPAIAFEISGRVYIEGGSGPCE